MKNQGNGEERERTEKIVNKNNETINKTKKIEHIKKRKKYTREKEKKQQKERTKRKYKCHA